jgi:adenine specific DNA methylase Mod
MIQDPLITKIECLEEKHPEKTNKILILGSKINILENFKSFFKNLFPRLIFLDLSMHYQTIKKEIRKEFCNLLAEKNHNDFLETIYAHTGEVTDEFWQKTEKIIENCKFMLQEEGFFSVKVNGTIKFRLKSILDTIFGSDRFVNEIIIDSPFKLWYTPNSTVFERTNYILLYSQSLSPRINPVLNEKESGGYWHSFVSKGQGTPKRFLFGDKSEVVLTPPPGTHWKLKQATILDLCAKGQIRLNKKGNPEYWVPRKKGQIIDSNWMDIQSFERIFDQKFTNSSNLYNRLIDMCLHEKDLFLDLSADVGGSLIVADRLKMKWVGLEENKQSFKLMVKNLTKKGISFSTYEHNSLPNSSGDYNYSILQNENKSTSDHLKPSKNLSLQLIERYNTSKVISSKEDSDEWTNMLILGDSFDVLPFLESKLRKQLKVIYIDPPFFTGTDENIVIPIGLSENTDLNVTENVLYPIEELAYENVLNASDPIEFFKRWFKKHVLLMRPLLRDDGFMFVRFDYHFGHYAKIVLDEVFGSHNFINEFVVRRMKKNLSLKQAYNQTHLIVHSDSVFLYQMSEEAKLTPFSIKKKKRKGQNFAERQYSSDNLWIDIVGYEKLKKTLYPTENSEALLSRIIQISSKKGDKIADFFCGSGTTIAVAEKLKRKWVGVDIGHYSIHETKKRILKIPHNTVFNVFNIIGSYYPNSRTQGLEADSAIDHVILEDKSSKGPLRNFPVAKLKVRVTNKKLEISVIEFIPSKSVDMSEKLNFVEYIDFWAIDWNCQDGNFEAMWYSYREMKGKKVLENVETSATHNYSDSGHYIVVATIVDVFGNNTRRSIDINIH